ncbi:MAG: hypothetical protein ACJ8AW_48740 [Rhodopila sp.]
MFGNAGPGYESVRQRAEPSPAARAACPAADNARLILALAERILAFADRSPFTRYRDFRPLPSIAARARVRKDVIGDCSLSSTHRPIWLLTGEQRAEILLLRSGSFGRI